MIELPKEKCMDSVMRILGELETTIPGLPERMTVRMLRNIIENGMVEVHSAELQCGNYNNWAVSMEIYDVMRNMIQALSLTNPGS